MPVDALLLKFDGAVLKIDESSVTGESDMIVKCTISDILANRSADAEAEPDSQCAVLISGSTVNEGTA